MFTDHQQKIAYVDFIKLQHMDILYRCLEYPKYVPPVIFRSEWVNRANLKGLATADQWMELVNEYFVYAEDEEGHEDKEHGETEPPGPEEEPQDPVYYFGPTKC